MFTFARSSFCTAKLLAAGTLSLALSVASLSAQSSTASEGKLGKLSDTELAYLQQTAKANLGEIVASYLAIEKAANNETKTVAKGIIDEHGKSMQKLMELASRHDAFLNLEPDLSAYQKLVAHGGTDFDKFFAAEQQRLNQEALDSLNKVMGQITASDVKDFAKEDLKDDQGHLEKAKELAAKLDKK